MSFGQPVTHVATITADGESIGKVAYAARSWFAVSVHRPDHVERLTSRVEAQQWLYRQAEAIEALV
jgi:hypothetical protein